MKILLLLPLLLGFSVPAIAHNEANGGEWTIKILPTNLKPNLYPADEGGGAESDLKSSYSITA